MGSAHNSMPILAASRDGCALLNRTARLGLLTKESGTWKSLQTRDSRRIIGSDMTRRELLEVAVVTGGALVGGQLMPGSISPAAAQAAAAPPAPLESCCASTEPSIG